LRAGDATAPEARTAQEGLCRDYWYPLYAFVRRKGDDPETAQGLAQGLFVRLLERDDIRGLESERGTVPSTWDGTGSRIGTGQRSDLAALFDAVRAGREASETGS
jgi:hypothetical protein